MEARQANTTAIIELRERTLTKKTNRKQYTMYRIFRQDNHCDGDYTSKAIAELAIKEWRYRQPKSKFTLVRLDYKTIKAASNFWKSAKMNKTILL